MYFTLHNLLPTLSCIVTVFLNIFFDILHYVFVLFVHFLPILFWLFPPVYSSNIFVLSSEMKPNVFKIINIDLRYIFVYLSFGYVVMEQVYINAVNGTLYR